MMKHIWKNNQIYFVEINTLMIQSKLTIESKQAGDWSKVIIHNAIRPKNMYKLQNKCWETEEGATT